MDEIRTFIAIPLPETVLKELASVINFLQQYSRGISWVKPQSSHLTLKFLGSLTQQELDKVFRGMDNLFKEPHDKISLEVVGRGGFPNLRRPRVLWLGIGGEELFKLYDLQSNIDAVLHLQGFPKDNKKFSPHITLGRVKFLHNFQEIRVKFLEYQLSSQKIIVDKVHIMRSLLKPQGAIYSIQKSYYF